MLRRIGRLFRIHPIGICGSFEFKAVGWAPPHTPLQTFCQMCFPSFPNGLGMAPKVSQAPGWSKDAGFYLAVSWSLNVGSYRFSHHFGAQVPSSYKRPCQHFHESQCSELYIPLLPCCRGFRGQQSEAWPLTTVPCLCLASIGTAASTDASISFKTYAAFVFLKNATSFWICTPGTCTW